MNIEASAVRIGYILKIEGGLYRVLWMQHVTPGRAMAFVQTKLKNIVTGKNLEKKFRSAETVEKAEVIVRPMQYLYADQDSFVFMDTESFEQISVNGEVLGESAIFLAAEGVYNIGLYEENPVTVELPNNVELTVVSAPPEVKKATASASLRPVTLENGMVVNAPAFIQEGDRIKISTETREYLERVK